MHVIKWDVYTLYNYPTPRKFNFKPYNFKSLKLNPRISKYNKLNSIIFEVTN